MCSIKKKREKVQEKTPVKRAIRKIAHKQMLWRVYKHTGNVEDYTNYKEALNLATTEIRKYKRTFEQRVSMLMQGVNRKFEIRSDHWKTTVKATFQTGSKWQRS